MGCNPAAFAPSEPVARERHVTGRISKIGDGGVRTALYEAANVILTRPVKGLDLPRKSGEFRMSEEELDDAAAPVYERI
jgi:hypothetical protein